mmetsp:Transcript_1541/g.2102  ORF Transcript_1541/g.2102 Transcript_1541/m.2102 type:complete len:209 (-) Transcript_1541:98-724(-)
MTSRKVMTASTKMPTRRSSSRRRPHQCPVARRRALSSPARKKRSKKKTVSMRKQTCLKKLVERQMKRTTGSPKAWELQPRMPPAWRKQTRCGRRTQKPLCSSALAPTLTLLLLRQLLQLLLLLLRPPEAACSNSQLSSSPAATTTMTMLLVRARTSERMEGPPLDRPARKIWWLHTATATRLKLSPRSRLRRREWLLTKQNWRSKRHC